VECSDVEVGRCKIYNNKVNNLVSNKESVEFIDTIFEDNDFE
jgi:hypothetical protein